jgi:hypothetical protein
MRLIPGTSDFVEASWTASCVASYHASANARPSGPNWWQASQTRPAFSGSGCACVVADDISGRYPKVNT